MLCLTCRLGQRLQLETTDGMITIYLDRKTGGHSVRLVIDAPRIVAVTRIDEEGRVIAKPPPRKKE